MANLTLSRFQSDFLKVPIVEQENQVRSQVKSPLVSVVVITYQHQNYIKQCLESIINQNRQFEFEIIIGDDDSTDGTREICLEYAEKYPAIIRLFLNSRKNNKSILGKPCGIIQIVNALLHARGKFVSICSGDDYWTDPNKLRLQVGFLQNHEECSLVYHSSVEKYVNSDGQETFSEPFSRFPKASTMMYRNFSEEIPEQFLNVLQEDVFSWFILDKKGAFHFMENVGETVIHTPPGSLSRSIDSRVHFKHALNVFSEIIEAYQNSEHEEAARLKMVSYLRGIFLCKRREFVKADILFTSLYILISKRLVFLFIKDSFQKLLKRI